MASLLMKVAFIYIRTICRCRSGWPEKRWGRGISEIRLIRRKRAPPTDGRPPYCPGEQRRGKGVGVRGRQLGPLVQPPKGLGYTQTTTLADVPPVAARARSG